MRCLTVRRLVTMLLCLTMIFLLTACGGQGEPNADDGGVSATGKISGGKDRASVPKAGSEKAEAALALLRRYPGRNPVWVHLAETKRTYQTKPPLTVRMTRQCADELTALLGEENVKFR